MIEYIIVVVVGEIGFALGIIVGKAQWCKRKYGHWNLFKKDVKLWRE